LKYHVAIKFAAIFFCAVFLLTAVGSLAGILSVAESGLYSSSVEDILQQRMESNLRSFANSLGKGYAAKNLSNCPDFLIEEHVYDFYPPLLTQDETLWFYSIKNERGLILEDRVTDEALDSALKLEFLINADYPVVLDYNVIDERPGIDQEETEQKLDDQFVPGKVLPPSDNEDYRYIETVTYEDDNGVTHNYRLGICEGPVYLVTLYLLPDAYAQESHWSWDLARLGHENRFNLIWVLGISVLLFAATLVYLCCSAGRCPAEETCAPGGLNRIPLDLYAAVVGAAITWLVIAGVQLIQWYLGHFEPMWMVFLGVGAMGFTASLLFVALLFALAAQVKVGEGWWLRHAALVWLSVRTYRFLRKAIPAVRKICVAAGTLVVKAVKSLKNLLRKAGRKIWRGLRRLVSLLPLAWQWLLMAVIIITSLWLTLDKALHWQIVGIGICVVMVLYGAYCFAMLLERTKIMSKGDLDTKVDDRLLVGGFREYAEHLNALADVAVDAARKQMKSERMKAELITNISHDIKTPLTSIINYVDLMRKVGSPEEAQAYLEVLGRQAQRLKKLIEDLIEMSKASTGNMNVELTQMDAVEAVNQALGEFHEKLHLASVTPVFTPAQEPIMITADGRLAWRVMSNLLSNAVKYAMPGTRLYVSMAKIKGQAHISLKNVSKEPLNVSPEELMERFVRGDASRNTEGSGLGLNIARSLMELQKGKLELRVDGDLFEATMIFNCVADAQW